MNKLVLGAMFSGVGIGVGVLFIAGIAYFAYTAGYSAGVEMCTNMLHETVDDLLEKSEEFKGEPEPE